MRRAALAAMALVLTVPGCGSDDDGASAALEDTTARLGQIRSGNLDLRVAVEPDTEGAAIGFELKGPFALPKGSAGLPRADMEYTQVAGPNQGQVGFVSDGKRAWVEVEEQAYRLPPEQTSGLRTSGGDGGGPLAELDVASWMTDAKVEDGDRVEGKATERVRGKVRVAAALNDMIGVLRKAGGADAAQGLPTLEGDDARQVDEAVSSAPIEVVIGKDDRLLRRLRMTVDFEVEARDLPGGLGRLSGAKVTFDLRIADPNGSVEVEAPDGALPYDQLPTAGAG